MQDGKALQFATSHNLGQNFSKVFNIQFTDENSQPVYAWQTSWGLSTRTIGGLIMTHSDNKGLVLPPNISPIQMVIIPIWKSDEIKEKVLKSAYALHDELCAKYGNSNVLIDDSNNTSGQKHYYWEKRGVPLRIEIGPRDIENNTVVLVRRDTSEKETQSIFSIAVSTSDFLNKIQKNLYEKALALREKNSVEVSRWDKFVEAIEAGKFVYAYWDGTTETEKKIKEETKATIRCIPFDEKNLQSGKCVYSQKASNIKVIFARSY